MSENWSNFFTFTVSYFCLAVAISTAYIELVQCWPTWYDLASFQDGNCWYTTALIECFIGSWLFELLIDHKLSKLIIISSVTFSSIDCWYSFYETMILYVLSLLFCCMLASLTTCLQWILLDLPALMMHQLRTLWLKWTCYSRRWFLMRPQKTKFTRSSSVWKRSLES